MISHELSWIIMNDHDLSRIIMNYHELSWLIMAYPDLSWILMTPNFLNPKTLTCKGTPYKFLSIWLIVKAPTLSQGKLRLGLSNWIKQRRSSLRYGKKLVSDTVGAVFRPIIVRFQHF